MPAGATPEPAGPPRSGTSTASSASSSPSSAARAPVRVRTLPQIDMDACGRTITYPRDAEALGIEGDVKLRVALDEHGGVHELTVLSGLGHGLDQAAERALRSQCSFAAAIGSDGNPMAYIIPSYTFHFELPR
jgi:TonB family protein